MNELIKNLYIINNKFSFEVENYIKNEKELKKQAETMFFIKNKENFLLSEEQLKNEFEKIKEKERDLVEKQKQIEIKKNLFEEKEKLLSSLRMEIEKEEQRIKSDEERIRKIKEKKIKDEIEKRRIEEMRINQERERKEEMERREIENKMREEKEKEKEKEKKMEMEKIKEATKNENKLQKGSEIYEKLIKGSDLYHQTKPLFIEISVLDKYKQETNKVYIIINETINQLTIPDDIKPQSIKITNLLTQYQINNSKEIYIYIIDTLLKMIYTKTPLFVNEKKSIYNIYARFIYEISRQHKLLEDLFFQFSCYICPYNIPRIFSFSEFNGNKDLFKKRCGFKNNEQKMDDFLLNMKGNSYLYFSYLLVSQRSDIIDEYVKSFKDGLISNYDYPIVIVYISFIDVLGNYIISKGESSIINTAESILQTYENLKKKPESMKIMRNTINSYVFSLGELIKKLKSNEKTGYLLEI